MPVFSGPIYIAIMMIEVIDWLIEAVCLTVVIPA
jgi:hypothetical protein